jgi:hypothetical protein
MGPSLAAHRCGPDQSGGAAGVPYPSLLAIAGAGLAFLPFAANPQANLLDGLGIYDSKWLSYWKVMKAYRDTQRISRRSVTKLLTATMAATHDIKERIF